MVCLTFRLSRNRALHYITGEANTEDNAAPIISTSVGFAGAPGNTDKPPVTVQWQYALVLSETAVALPVPSRQMSEMDLKLGHDRFLPHPLHFTIHQSSHHSKLHSDLLTVSLSKPQKYKILLCMQQTVTGLYPEPDESSQHCLILFPEYLFNMNFPLKLMTQFGVFLSLSLKLCRVRCPVWLTLSDMLDFLGQRLLSPRLNLNLASHPLSAVCYCLFNIFAVTLNVGCPPSLYASNSSDKGPAHSSKDNGNHMYHLLYHEILCILPTQCICVFRMILTINSDRFPKQH
jgi:hypothetical protein